MELSKGQSAAATLILWLLVLPTLSVAIAACIATLQITSDTVSLGKIVFIQLFVAVSALGIVLARISRGAARTLQIVATIVHVMAVLWLSYRFTGAWQFLK